MELPGAWPDGFYVGNFSGMPLYFVAYDANQLMLGPLQFPPLIESPASGPQVTNTQGNGWFLPADAIGRTDRIFVLAFFDTPEQFNPPPAIDLRQSTSGGGGSVSILGFGGGVSVSVSTFYSVPSAAALMVLADLSFGPGSARKACGLEVRTDQTDPKHPLVLAFHDFNNGMMMDAAQYTVPMVRDVLRLEESAIAV